MKKNTDKHRQTPSPEDDGLIQKHGGYEQLLTFQLSEVIYDVTVRFCEKYLDPKSRTVDQMVQAARSGRQNIAEGSVDSGTSKKIEMKLTGVARGSLVELQLDYQGYLRQRGLPQWDPDHPALQRFKAKRCRNLEEFRTWVGEEMKLLGTENTDEQGQAPTESEARDEAPARNTDEQGLTRTRAKTREGGARVRPCVSVFVANGALSLLNLCIYLLERQLQSQAATFEQEGGFTERLYGRRKSARARQTHLETHKKAPQD